MKFIMKHGKSEKDIQNLRQEIEVSKSLSPFMENQSFASCQCTCVVVYELHYAMTCKS